MIFFFFFPYPIVFQVGGDADLLRALAAGPGAEERQSAQNPAMHSESNQDIRWVEPRVTLTESR